MQTAFSSRATSAGIGRVVDSNLKTEVEGLYVCDASVIPHSMGVPLVLILVSLGRWFARELTAVAEAQPRERSEAQS
jgi:choline dehydrogenase-like flavoprotein